MGGCMRKIFGVGALSLFLASGLKGMPPGGDAYMEREWRRRSDSLFVAEVQKTQSQLPTWWAMPEPKVSIAPSSGTRYVDPNTGQAHWNFSGYYRIVEGTYGNNTTDIPQIKIVPADSVNSDKGLVPVK